MITIKTIITLVENHGLDNIRFRAEDASKVPIVVEKREIYFKCSYSPLINIKDISSNVIEEIDKENYYFIDERELSE